MMQMRRFDRRCDTSRRHRLACRADDPAARLAATRRADGCVAPDRDDRDRRADRVRREEAAQDAPWAYAFARPQRPGDTPIDWRRTKFREDCEHGIMGDDVMVLLRQDGARWNVVEYVIGPSDVAWDGWRQERRPPRQVSTDQRRAAHGGALSADMS